MSKQIHFTPKAEKQMRLVSGLDAVNSGFVLGMEIGKHVVIEELINIDIDDRNIDKVYVEVLDKIGEKLIGLFFKKGKFFKSDWFSGDLIIEIGDKKHETFLYERMEVK